MLKSNIPGQKHNIGMSSSAPMFLKNTPQTFVPEKPANEPEVLALVVWHPWRRTSAALLASTFFIGGGIT